MKFHHVGISVLNLEESAQFYKENFGFVETQRFTKPGWDGSAIILSLDGINLELFHFKDMISNKDDSSNLKVVGIKHIAIKVKSVLEKYEELKRKNIDIDEPIKGTTCAWFCFLRDPNKLSIELYETL